jgi:hypothetical protein
MKVSGWANSGLASAAVFICCGAGLLIAGRDYPLGTMMRIGPGIFPMFVGWGLIVVGLVEAGRGIARSGGHLGAWGYRPLVIVASTFFVFALLVERLGLVITGMLVMGLATFAGSDTPTAKHIAILMLGPVVTSFVFIYLLNVPLKAWP